MRHSRILARLSGLLAFVYLGSAGAGINSWTLTGPEGGIAVSIAIHPTDPSLRVVSTPQGLYRSDNGGLSWNLAAGSSFYNLEDLTYDPTNLNRIYAIASGLYVSNDGGLSFAPAQGPATLSSLSRLTFAPDGTLYVGGLGGRLWRSDGSLSAWTELPITWDNTALIGALATDPSNPGTVYAAVNNVGVFRSTDRGDTWSGPLTGAPAPPNATTFSSMSVDPSDPARVLVASFAGVHRSINSGASWTMASPTPTRWVGYDPTTPNCAIAVQFYGTVVRSSDAGATFPQYAADLRLPPNLDAAFDPHHAGHFWLVGENGVMHSVDRADTFTYRNVGIRSGYVREFATADDGTVLIGMNAGDGTIFRRGTNYTALDPAALRAVTWGPFTLNALAVSATDSSRILAVINDRQLVRTTNGGVTWSAPHQQFLSSDGITALAIDPSNPLVAYVMQPNSGLWKSIDGGASWTHRAGAPRTSAVLGIDPANTDILYLAGGDGSIDQIYKSINGGLTWSLKLDTQQSRTFTSFAFDPGNTGTLYATGFGGIHKSTDSGENWTPVVGNYVAGGVISNLLIDPLHPTTMVAVGNNTAEGFVRTVDGGATWDLIRYDRPGKAPQIYGGVLDPLAPHRLILGAGGAGVAEYDIAPDLEIRLASPATAVPLDQPAAFSFTVRNLGPHHSSASTVRLPLPAWSIASLPSGCTSAANGIECEIGVVRVNETRTVDFVINAPSAAGFAQIDASVAGYEPDPSSSNDAARITLQASEHAELVVSFTGANPPLDNHGTVVLPIDVTNSGPNASTQTVLTIELAQPAQTAALTAPTVTTTQGTCALAGTAITCALGTLNRNAVAQVRVSATASVVGTTQVTAVADGAGTDLGAGHGATRSLTIRPVADLAVEVADSADPATINVPWNYTTTVRNNGPDAGAASLSIVLSGAAATDVTTTSGTCTQSGGAAACTFPSLASGGQATVTLTVLSTASGTASAAATATFDGTDSAAANNSATANTTKVAPASQTTQSGGGGGGGRFDGLLLMLLGVAGASRIRRRLASHLR